MAQNEDPDDGFTLDRVQRLALVVNPLLKRLRKARLQLRFAQAALKGFQPGGSNDFERRLELDDAVEAAQRNLDDTGEELEILGARWDPVRSYATFDDSEFPDHILIVDPFAEDEFDCVRRESNY